MYGITRGWVTAVRDGAIEGSLPGARIGARVRCAHGMRGRVIALSDTRVRIAPLDSLDGCAVGDSLELSPGDERVVLGSALLGRSCDSSGAPLDGGAAIQGARSSFALQPPAPNDRAPILQPLWSGVRAIDTLLTFGRGARIGILGGAGVGKSTLLESIALGASADAVIWALIGERGREAERAIERNDARTTCIVATSAGRAAEWVLAAEFAMAHAMHLRARGLHVLLLLDSLARYATALRELAIVRGEGLGRGGWPPSVVPTLARWLECAGATRSGSISVVASVLAADAEDPLLEASSALLDGHIVLSPELAHAGRFPAIEILASTSRTMEGVVTPEHRLQAQRVRAALAILEQSAQARALGIFGGGAPLVAALEAEPMLRALLEQSGEPEPPERSLSMLAEVADRL
ncbi:MAG TPA: EscN/YscN/HrcN family type III secretion system ATPase [Candidatus Dormibacteraeota bacterium]|nr:EscN/YscN/HrcN family type III secretion system ATPase [Candidatus Dormibacteraeota bacterium]